ncbi:MAG: branched-chain amino acid ABC transporter permease [Thermoanaerobacterium sp.]|nr:branched-chain amino acid ABC transporter permease [Thermoanaerobacterium sp.]
MVSTILQLIISGVAMGFIYALVGIEFTIIYNASGLVNFAHDKFIMFAAYVFAGTFVLGLGLNPIISTILLFIVMALFGALVAAGIFNPLRNMSSDIYAVMGTIMLAKILTEVARISWGPDPFTISGFLQGVVHVGNVVLPKANIYIIIVSLIIFIGLQMFFNNTKYGKAMRCVAQNKEASAIVGINVPQIIQMSVALSAVICGVIAILVIPLFNVDVNIASMIGIKGFAATVIGGFGNLFGNIIGGLFVGLLENAVVMILPAVYKDTVAFVLLILFLLIKPEGILSKKS